MNEIRYTDVTFHEKISLLNIVTREFVIRRIVALFVTVGAAVARIILYTGHVGKGGKGYGLFQRYFKTMPCWGQVNIPLSATALPYVDLHNHHGLPYKAFW